MRSCEILAANETGMKIILEFTHPLRLPVIRGGRNSCRGAIFLGNLSPGREAILLRDGFPGSPALLEEIFFILQIIK